MAQSSHEEVNIQNASVPYRIYDEAGRLMKNWSRTPVSTPLNGRLERMSLHLANGASARFAVVR